MLDFLKEERYAIFLIIVLAIVIKSFILVIGKLIRGHTISANLLWATGLFTSIFIYFQFLR